MVNTATSREYTLETLQKPDFLTEDCSTICVHHLHSDVIAVGHEQGAYITSIEANPGTITPLSQFNDKEVFYLSHFVLMTLLGPVPILRVG